MSKKLMPFRKCYIYALVLFICVVLTSAQLWTCCLSTQLRLVSLTILFLNRIFSLWNYVSEPILAKTVKNENHFFGT